MHVTPTGGRVLPKQTVYLRKVAKGRKEHFTGHFVVGEPGDERILDIESHTELMVGLVLSARRDVVALENQVPFRWLADNGRPATHFFDFRANLADGTRIAVMVKSAHRLKSERLRRELEAVARQVTPDFADRVVVMTEKHLDRIEVHNAEIMHEMRESEPSVDAAARREIQALHGEISIDRLQDAIGAGGQGFRAIVRLLRTGVLELAGPQRISPDAIVRRRTI
ncbi:PDDEXK family nuclease [Tropicibacter oceani]|uniref:TnsA endonuclease N-terminal domain-containing protein n=1 Tax=Tropicibacter oceani TaxID=3058420 RepID=A0ABY8QKD6_9RHOB|nr:hypothetical protein [Tropicibacter oceani]WGW05096.1 hypothetical protein QF118_05985 [Tropicibacter oceani]